MRRIRDKSDFYREQYRKLTPRNGIPVGGAHIDPFWKAEALSRYLCTLARSSPDAAFDAAAEEARLIIETWNRRREYQVRRATCGIESFLLRFHKMILDSQRLKGPRLL
jgi:hypothetical protein